MIRKMDDGNIGVVERALQLAGEGKIKTVKEIGVALMQEGYDHAPQHLLGQSIRRQLRLIIKQSSQTL